MGRTKSIISWILISAMILSLNSFTTFAEEVNIDTLAENATQKTNIEYSNNIDSIYFDEEDITQKEKDSTERDENKTKISEEGTEIEEENTKNEEKSSEESNTEKTEDIVATESTVNDSFVEVKVAKLDLNQI